MRLGVCDESKSPGPFGRGVFHDNDVHDLAPLLEVLLQGVVGRPEVQAADEQLPELLGFGFFAALEIR